MDGAVPLSVLRTHTRVTLSAMLNPQKVIPNENGVPRDWRGLMHYIGLSSDQVRANDLDPVTTILQIWQRDKDTYTVGTLQDFLAKLDRYDVLDDTRELIESDIKSSQQQDNLSTTDDRILTVHDPIRLSQGLGPQMFDAFVVFSYDDIDFATELIDKMEKDYGLRLCAKERDLVAGLQFEYSAIIELVAQRCNRLIAVLSPSFINSPADKFVMNYAQAVGIEQKCRKIIPCVYKQCKMPPELENIYHLDYERLTQRNLFWEKLRRSIEVPAVPSISVSHPEISKIQETVDDLTPKKPKKDRVTFNELTVPALRDSQHTVSTPALYTSTSSMDARKPSANPPKKISLLPRFLKRSKKGENKTKTDKKKHSKLKMLSLF